MYIACTYYVFDLSSEILRLWRVRLSDAGTWLTRRRRRKLPAEVGLPFVQEVAGYVFSNAIKKVTDRAQPGDDTGASAAADTLSYWIRSFGQGASHKLDEYARSDDPSVDLELALGKLAGDQDESKMIDLATELIWRSADVDGGIEENYSLSEETMTATIHDFFVNTFPELIGNIGTN